MTDRTSPVVWLDFGGVLTPPIIESVQRVVEDTGLGWDILADAIDDVAASHAVTGIGPLERGLLTQEEWGAQVDARLKASGHEPALSLRQIDRPWHRDRVLDAAFIDAVMSLRDNGVRVGMVTNSVAEWEPYRERLLAATSWHIDAAFRSHERRLAKPDHEVWRTCDALLPPGGLAPILVDDTEINCVSARRHGWAAIHHRDAFSTLDLLRVYLAGARS